MLELQRRILIHKIGEEKTSLGKYQILKDKKGVVLLRHFKTSHLEDAAFIQE